MVIKLGAFVQIESKVYQVKMYVKMFASVYVYACLNIGCHLVAYEANHVVLMSFSVHFVHCLLIVLECKHQHNP